MTRNVWIPGFSRVLVLALMLCGFSLAVVAADANRDAPLASALHHLGCQLVAGTSYRSG